VISFKESSERFLRDNLFLFTFNYILISLAVILVYLNLSNFFGSNIPLFAYLGGGSAIEKTLNKTVLSIVILIASIVITIIITLFYLSFTLGYAFYYVGIISKIKDFFNKFEKGKKWSRKIRTFILRFLERKFFHSIFQSNVAILFLFLNAFLFVSRFYFKFSTMINRDSMLGFLVLSLICISVILLISIYIPALSLRSEGFAYSFPTEIGKRTIELLLAYATYIAFTYVIFAFGKDIHVSSLELSITLYAGLIVFWGGSLRWIFYNYNYRYELLDKTIRKKVEKQIQRMRDHTVILGFENVGSALLNHFLQTDILKKENKIKNPRVNFQERVSKRITRKNPFFCLYFPLLVVCSVLNFFLFLKNLFSYNSRGTKTVFLSKYSISRREIIENILVIDLNSSDIIEVGTHQGIKYGYIDFPSLKLIVPAIKSDMKETTSFIFGRVDLCDNLFQTSDEIEVSTKILNYLYELVPNTDYTNYSKNIIIRAASATHIKLINSIKNKWETKYKGFIKEELRFRIFTILPNLYIANTLCYTLAFIDQIRNKSASESIEGREKEEEVYPQVFLNYCNNNTRLAHYLQLQISSQQGFFKHNETMDSTLLNFYKDGFPEYLLNAGVLREIKLRGATKYFNGKTYLYTRNKSSLQNSFFTSIYSKELLEDSVYEYLRLRDLFYSEYILIKITEKELRFELSNKIFFMSSVDTKTYLDDFIRLIKVLSNFSEKCTKDHKQFFVLLHTRTKEEFNYLLNMFAFKKSEIEIESKDTIQNTPKLSSLTILSESSISAKQMVGICQAMIEAEKRGIGCNFAEACISDLGAINANKNLKKLADSKKSSLDIPDSCFRVESIQAYFCGNNYDSLDSNKIAHLKIWISVPLNEEDIKGADTAVEKRIINRQCHWATECSIASSIKCNKVDIQQRTKRRLVLFEVCANGEKGGVLFSFLLVLSVVFSLHVKKGNYNTFNSILENYYINEESTLNLCFLQLTNCHYSANKKHLVYISSNKENPSKEKDSTQKDKGFSEFLSQQLTIEKMNQGEEKNKQSILDFLLSNIIKIHIHIANAADHYFESYTNTEIFAKNKTRKKERKKEKKKKKKEEEEEKEEKEENKEKEEEEKEEKEENKEKEEEEKEEKEENKEKEEEEKEEEENKKQLFTILKNTFELVYNKSKESIFEKGEEEKKNSEKEESYQNKYHCSNHINGNLNINNKRESEIKILDSDYRNLCPLVINEMILESEKE